MESYNLYIFISMWLIAYGLTRAALAELFRKAGVAWYLALIPIVSWWYWIKIVGRPKWYIIGMCIPCVNILFSFNITLDLLRSYGKFKFWEHLLGTVLTFVYLPLIAWRKDTKYMGPAGQAEWRQKHIPKHKWHREWGDAILFALYVAGGMRALYFDLFVIPTPSMESNMKVGDFLVVSRAKIGMRIPMTPITIPVIAHKEIAGFQIFSDIVELPYMRLPGWYTIKNNDVVVFNWPSDDDRFPVDKKDNYVKRCVGVPGDTLMVKAGQVYINGKLLPKVGKQQKRYILALKAPITTDFLANYELGDCKNFTPDGTNVMKYSYIINTWEENVTELRKDPDFLTILVDSNAGRMSGHYIPFLDSSYINGKWMNSDLDNYGPFYLPKRGEEITLTARNFRFYGPAINRYEKAEVTFDGKDFYRDGQPIKTYKFKYGYFWMMGDNRYNSYDSRGWGYVPENHIVGKPLFTFFSIRKAQLIVDGNAQFSEHMDIIYESKGIRWDKIFKRID